MCPLESFVNPPADGLKASLAMVDAFRASEALNELRTARNALLDAYAGLARAFEYEADYATVYDERRRDATDTARRVVAGIRSFCAQFRDATDDVSAMAAGLHSLEGARLYPPTRSTTSTTCTGCSTATATSNSTSSRHGPHSNPHASPQPTKPT